MEATMDQEEINERKRLECIEMANKFANKDYVELEFKTITLDETIVIDDKVRNKLYYQQSFKKIYTFTDMKEYRINEDKILNECVKLGIDASDKDAVTLLVQSTIKNKEVA